MTRNSDEGASMPVRSALAATLPDAFIQNSVGTSFMLGGEQQER